MRALGEGNAAAMRAVLERALAGQGFSVAWDGAPGPRVIALPASLPDELWALAHEPFEPFEIPHRPGTPRPSRFVATSGPGFPHEVRDRIWNAVSGRIGAQGLLTDSRDHPALRAAGYVIVPLRLIAELWEAAHAAPADEADAEPAPGLAP